MKKKIVIYFIVIILFILNISSLNKVNYLIDLFTDYDKIYKIPVKIRKSTMENIFLFTSNEKIIRDNYILDNNVYKYNGTHENIDSLYNAIYNPLIFSYKIRSMDRKDAKVLFNDTINTEVIDIFTIFKYMNSSQTQQIYGNYLSNFNSSELNNIYIDAVKSEYNNLNISLFDVNREDIIYSLIYLFISMLLVFLGLYFIKFDKIDKNYLIILYLIYLGYLIFKLDLIDIIILFIVLIIYYISKKIINFSKYKLFKINILASIFSFIIAIVFNHKIILVWYVDFLLIGILICNDVRSSLKYGQENKKNIKFREKETKE